LVGEHVLETCIFREGTYEKAVMTMTKMMMMLLAAADRPDRLIGADAARGLML
jgi:hypothetical protein